MSEIEDLQTLSDGDAFLDDMRLKYRKNSAKQADEEADREKITAIASARLADERSRHARQLGRAAAYSKGGLVEGHHKNGLAGVVPSRGAHSK